MGVLDISPQPQRVSQTRTHCQHSCRRSLTRLLYIVAASLSIAVVLPDARAQCPVERVGQWGGASYAVAVQGDFAYAGMGAKFIVLDISDPQSPTLVGSILTRGTVTDVALSGQHAFVCTDNISMEIIDISNNTVPTLIGEYFTGYPPKRVLVDGNYAYVLSENMGFHVVDISDPSAPVRVGQYGICCPVDMAKSGNYVYIQQDGYFLIRAVLIDLSNPTSPVFVSNVSELHAIERMLVSGNRLYTLWSYGALFKIFDISNPSAPELLGYEGLSTATSISVVDELACVTTYDGLVIFDVSNPADPALVGQSSGAISTDVSIQGDLAVVSEIGGTVCTIEISDPQSPQRKGAYREVALPRSIVVSGTHAFVTSSLFNPALQVLSLVNPAAPVFAGQSTEYLEDGYGDLAIQDDVVFLTDVFDGLLIYDVSDPAAPTMLGSSSGHGWHDIAVEGTIAYLISGGTVSSVEVSDPTFPMVLDELSYFDFESLEAIAALGGALYVLPYAGSGHGAHVVDATTPSSMSVVGTFPGSLYPTDVDISGNRAYLEDYDDGLQIYDVSNPLSPVRLSPPNKLFGEKIAARGEIAYLDSKIVDVSNSAVPTVVATYASPGIVSGLDVLGSYLYVSSFYAGVSVFRTCIPGDVNCDSAVNGLDVAAFTEAVLDQVGFQSAYPYCNPLNADVDESGGVDEFDIAPFVERILAQ